MEIQSVDCMLCKDGMDSVKHLFFQCSYSGRCLRAVKDWFNINTKKMQLTELQAWIQKKKGITKVRRCVLYAGLAACVYQIWKSRNEALWQHKVRTVEQTIKSIKCDVYNRMYTGLPKKVVLKDREWIEQLCKSM